MGGVGYTSHDSDRSVVGALEPVRLLAEHVLYLVSKEVTILFRVKLHPTVRVGKVELLVDASVFVNVSCNFLKHVQLTSI